MLDFPKYPEQYDECGSINYIYQVLKTALLSVLTYMDIQKIKKLLFLIFNYIFSNGKRITTPVSSNL